MQTQTETAAVVVNGVTVEMAGVAPHTNALDFLRSQGLTGAKEGCAEGECGACSILVARPGVVAQAPTEWVAINACLIPVAGLDGQEVLTAEGLGTSQDLHVVQREMAVRGGSQCGYCTPGFVCSMAAEYYRPGRCPNDSEAAPEALSGSGGTDPGAGGTDSGAGDHEHGPNGFDLHALSGNLCRCTGYRPIRDAAYSLGVPEADDPVVARTRMVPPAPVHTRIGGDDTAYLRPVDLAETVALLADRPDAVLVAGSTDLGVEVNIRGTRPALVVGIDRLPELRGLEVTDDEFRIGAALTLTEIERRLDGAVPLLAQLFPQFASRLIRNGATLGGNLGTGSPIGDSPPVLLALDARLVLAGAEGERIVPLAEYFTGYRQTVRQPGELIREIRIPRPLAPLTAFHKIAKRRFDDISSVAVGYALTVTDGIVTHARIGLGGVAATPLRALEAEAELIDRPWSSDTVETAAAALGAAGTPMSDHRASSDFRVAMLRQSLRKLFALNPEGGRS